MNVRKVAMVVGIIGGVYAILPAILTGTLIGAAIAVSSSGFLGLLYGLLTVAAPIAGLVGAGIVRKKPLIGSSLMALGGVGMIVFTNVFGFFQSAFFFVGAILGIIGKYQS